MEQFLTLLNWASIPLFLLAVVIIFHLQKGGTSGSSRHTNMLRIALFLVLAVAAVPLFLKIGPYIG